MPISLRDFNAQADKNRASFDLKTIDGIIHPTSGPTFTGPNGCSLRPSGPKMHEILKGYKGDPRVYRMHEGLILPEGMVILHEHTDHYSLQPSVPTPLGEFNARITDLIQGLPSMTREQFFAALEDPDDQDN